MSRSGNEPDQDSMMALQALLKIRSENVTESSAGAKSQIGSAAALQGASSAFSVPTKSGVTFAQHVVPMQVVSVQHTLDASQFKSVPTLNPPIVQKGGQDVNNTSPRFLPTPPLNAESSSLDVIRKDQIEAALRSKPQRGRKRENLSVLERLELTRTRNREHAKSTRIRKKARYQELVDKEAKYEELKRDQNLHSSRIEAVCNFLSCRNQTLQNEHSSEKYRDNIIKALHNPVMFRFEIQGSAVPAENDNALERLNCFECILRSNFSKNGLKDDTQPLSYKIVGGRDAVAIGKSGVATTELSIVETGKEDKVLLSALVRWTFAAASDKLTKLQWTTITDSIMKNSCCERRTEGARSEDTLGSQTCYPSVVSLDPHTSNDMEKTRNSDEGPGMNI